MYLSDEQLMLLEQLTYIDEVENQMGITLPQGSRSLGEYIDVLAGNPDLMDSIRQQNWPFTSGEQWADIIEAVAADEDLRRLVPYDDNESVYARSFTDPDDSTKGVVIFKGTADAREWDDDVRGLNVADTPCQLEAKDYIEGLPFDSITVAGHSKGGNKAQYVTVTSDKVDRCVSMDGQGFSQEFMDKYWAEIEEKGHLVKNYSLDADYVHILLFPLPDAEQIYIRSDPNNRGLQNHSPANLLDFDENGQVYLQIAPGELESVTYLRELTYFVINTASDEHKQMLVDLIGPVLAVSMSKTFTYEGKVYTQDNIIDYILSQPEAIAVLLAYLTKYIETYNLDGDKVNSILEAFGMFLDFKGGDILLELLTKLVRFVLGNLGDGKTDAIIEAVLKELENWLEQEFGKQLDLVHIWNSAEQTYESIDVPDPTTANQPTVPRKDKIRDFSERIYNTIMSAISRVGGLTYNSVAGWNSYESEPWYDDLFIRKLREGIAAYCDGIQQINEDCKTKIDRIFNDAATLDAACAAKLASCEETVKGAASNL